MGFFAMILSFFAGLLLIVFGFYDRKSQNRKILNRFSIIVGICLVLFAVWLGLPK